MSDNKWDLDELNSMINGNLEAADHEQKELDKVSAEIDALLKEIEQLSKEKSDSFSIDDDFEEMDTFSVPDEVVGRRSGRNTNPQRRPVRREGIDALRKAEHEALRKEEYEAERRAEREAKEAEKAERRAEREAERAEKKEFEKELKKEAKKEAEKAARREEVKREAEREAKKKARREAERAERKDARKEAERAKRKKAKAPADFDRDLDFEDVADRDTSKKSKKKAKKKGRWKGHVIRSLIAIILLVVLYCTAVFSHIPFIEKWRTIYIETAMNTNTHHWLATYFIPKCVIDEVMEKRKLSVELQKDLDSSWAEMDTSKLKFDNTKDEFYAKYWELDTDEMREYFETHPSVVEDGYDQIFFEDYDGIRGIKTSNGDPVVVLDVPNDLLIVEVSGDRYKGKLAIVKDASRVDLEKAEYFGGVGEMIESFGERLDAVLAVNASGFADSKGVGNGGRIKGSMVVDGQEYGHPEGGTWKFFGLKYDNRMYITNYYQAKNEEFRWAMEFLPALIVDGKNVVDGTFGMGINPRACLGQGENGDLMLLIVDGRQVGYSIGCTVAECADILEEYNAYQAANMDGGSSAVMWYKGKLINKPSSVDGRGRSIPNALILK